MSSGSSRLLILLLPGVLGSVLAPACSALDRSNASLQNWHLTPVRATRTAGTHSAHGDVQTTHSQSLIGLVRFNQKAIPFEQGVTAGPGPGNLEIQFAAPLSADIDHLRYRLLGFDSEWREAGKERSVLYSHLPTGHYRFDFEASTGGRGRTSTAESLTIVVVPPYWQSGQFRGLCAIFLLFVVLALHKLRVRALKRRAGKLEENVTRTRAELVLAVKTAGDAQQALKEQALKDSLTGLWNRGAIFAMLEKELCRAQRDHLPITVVMIDMDHFKNINDTYGHQMGDTVLREAASRLFEVMRPYDIAGRYGGEEFLIVLPSCSARNGIQRAEHFRRAIAERPVPTALGPLAVSCSLGVASYDQAMPPEELIHRADEALYRAKKLGRNCVCAAAQHSDRITG